MTAIAKKLFITFLIGTAIFIIGSFLYNGFDYESIKDLLISFSFYQLYSFVLGFSNMAFFEYLDKVKWKEHKIVNINRIIIGLVGAVIITMIGLFLLRMSTALVYKGLTISEFIAGESYKKLCFWPMDNINIYCCVSCDLFLQ